MPDAEAESSPSERYAKFRAEQKAPVLADFCQLYKFPLDDFQVRACETLESGDGCCLAAPTGRQVRIRHSSPVRDEETTRVVDPIAVSHADGHSYLNAWDHSVDDRRLFRLDRVLRPRCSTCRRRSATRSSRSTWRKASSGRHRTRCSPPRG